MTKKLVLLNIINDRKHAFPLSNPYLLCMVFTWEFFLN